MSEGYSNSRKDSTNKPDTLPKRHSSTAIREPNPRNSSSSSSSSRSSPSTPVAHIYALQPETVFQSLDTVSEGLDNSTPEQILSLVDSSTPPTSSVIRQSFSTQHSHRVSASNENLSTFLQSSAAETRGSIAPSEASLVDSLENLNDPTSRDNVAPLLHSPPSPRVSISTDVVIAPVAIQMKDNSANIPNLSLHRGNSRSQNHSNSATSSIPLTSVPAHNTYPPKPHDLEIVIPAPARHGAQPSIGSMTGFATSPIDPMKPSIGNSSTAASDHRRKVRNYQVFPGRNRFYFGGRILTSRDGWPFLVAFGLLVVPSVLFTIFVCPWLWSNLHPAIPIVFAYLFLLAIVSMLRTSLADPGIIPRNLDPYPPLDDFDSPFPSSPDGIGRSSFAFGNNVSRALPVQKQVTVNDTIVRLKYCETCRIYRPPRASHCRQCDNCVENEDHHCVWLNNCIGRRNYRSFFTFIVTATLICFYVIGCCIIQLVLVYNLSSSQSFLQVVQKAPVALALAVICFVLIWSVGSLSVYHIFLVSRNVTTHEQLRASVVRRQFSENPFDFHNMFLNCLYVLCRPRSKSYLQRRKYAPEHEHELSHVQPQLFTTLAYPPATLTSELSSSAAGNVTALDMLKNKV